MPCVSRPPHEKRRRRAALAAAAALALTGAAGLWQIGAVSQLTGFAMAENYAATPEAAITDYFSALGRSDYSTAYALLTTGFRAGLKPADLAHNQLRRANVAAITPLGRDPGPTERYNFTVTVDAEPSGDGPWSAGRNVRFVLVTRTNAGWQLDYISNGP